MRLLVFLFYAILGYILWRMIRVGIRMMQGSREDEDGRVRGTRTEPPARPMDFQSGEIKDAKFEDITPPRDDAKGAAKNNT